ncbi:putative DsbA family dithiol-disulfide isomerase [Humibacillus xanthopallidus]|uniref:Putative DsbA family dithiol-disulfide isomerase n=1 Tax=Humibacillus xanthopallidus TaxID=412689 RepID=A0A543PRP3_9MICO|nr:DsbA family oxidoreductase [Humibacillus xanthopallidus]TQN46747.1 putative DsbA family dithiol-disulfide isomerase [Humibacillus xanthopallidus]
MKVEIWSAIACPWCYIGKRRFEAALAAFPHRDDVEVHWRSYQLDPTLPDHHDGSELDYLVDRKGMSRAQVSQMFDQVTAIAAEEGLRYDFGSVVVANSFAGHELLHLAKARGAGDAVKEALLSAHFEHGEDIGDRDVLVRIGTEAGLDADEIVRDLASHTWRDAVVADITAANSLGIRGVPFFVLDDKYGISGAQPADVFTQALDQAWRESHPLVMVQPSGAADDVACGPDGCAI